MNTTFVKSVPSGPCTALFGRHATAPPDLIAGHLHCSDGCRPSQFRPPHAHVLVAYCHTVHGSPTLECGAEVPPGKICVRNTVAMLLIGASRRLDDFSIVVVVRQECPLHFTAAAGEPCLAVSIPLPTVCPGVFRNGDADFDGLISLLDLDSIAKAIVGAVQLTECQTIGADGKHSRVLTHEKHGLECSLRWNSHTRNDVCHAAQGFPTRS